VGAPAVGRAVCRGSGATMRSLTGRGCEHGGITPVLATRGIAYGNGWGLSSWVVEWTLAWLPQWHRLRVRGERRGDIDEGLLKLGCALISAENSEAFFIRGGKCQFMSYCWRYLLQFC
jgi:hypothetical protein